MTAAHDGRQSHHYMLHFPEHPAREDDPHYVDFNHYHQLHRPTARCYVGERIGFEDCLDAKGKPCPPPPDGGPQPSLELHHAHVEFSLQNGISLTALEHDYPGISDTTNVGAWVESDVNFRWLCVLPGTPVLMGDLSLMPIETIVPGDYVIGKDGAPHLVELVGSRTYDGIVERWGDCLLTSAHEMLTENGWLRASAVRGEMRVIMAGVPTLSTMQSMVRNPILRPAPDGTDYITKILATPRFHGSAFYSGFVYDIQVADAHSFFAGGIAVHNCVFHHRGPGGAHTASHSDWEASCLVPGLIGR